MCTVLIFMVAIIEKIYLTTCFLPTNNIIQASGSTLKNIMNFCFDLKRAEKLNEHPVSLVKVYYFITHENI